MELTMAGQRSKNIIGTSGRGKANGVGTGKRWCGYGYYCSQARLIDLQYLTIQVYYPCNLHAISRHVPKKDPKQGNAMPAPLVQF